MFKRNSRRINPNLYQEEIKYGGSILEKILHSRKIKYTILNNLFKNKIPSNKDTVNMYIDLNNLLNSFYNPMNMEEFKTVNDSEKISISSEILNIVAHYRNYFVTRHDMYSNYIFFYSTDRDKESIKILESYKDDYYQKRIDNHPTFSIINKVLYKQIKLSSLISKYIPFVYFIDTKDVNPDIVPYYSIQNQKDNEFSIIYSNNKLQSINTLSKNDTMILTIQGDNSKLISNSEMIEYITKKDYNFSNNMIPYIFSIAGFKDYNVSGIPGYGMIKSSNIINKLIRSGDLSDIIYMDIDMFIDDISKSEEFNENEINVIKRNTLLFQSEFIMDRVKENEIIDIFSTNMIDLIDAKSLHSINNKYFELHPLLLNELLAGEEYE